MTVDKLVPPLGGHLTFAIMAMFGFLMLSGWILVCIWRRARSGGEAPASAAPVEQWVERFERAAELASGNVRAAHLLMAAELRDIMGEYIGLDVASWSAGEISRVDEAVGTLIGSWEEPSFSFAADGDLERATAAGVEVIRRWS